MSGITTTTAAMGYSGLNYNLPGGLNIPMLNINGSLISSATGAFNDTAAFNASGGMSQEEIKRLLQEYRRNHYMSNFDQVTLIILLTAFALLILFGVSGNGLVCYVVARNPHMRTPRNIYIINLAISDLTLCLFTQPLNLLKVCANQWVLGEFMCKFVPMFAGTNVFVSTISITAIALDRFQVIVYPTKDSMKKVGTVIALVSIWLISFLMASPLLIFNRINPVEVIPGDVLFEGCVENSKLMYERGAYSVACMIFQYLVPILIVSVAHARICNKLKYRMVNQQSSPQHAFQKQKSAREAKRKRRTNILLVMIGIVFACAWLPLNVFNIMADFNHALFQRINPRGLIVPICHLLVLSSACTNPVLYGWLNENFRKEFLKVLCSSGIRRCFASCKCACRERSERVTTTTTRTQLNGTLATRETELINPKNNNGSNNEITAV